MQMSMGRQGTENAKAPRQEHSWCSREIAQRLPWLKHGKKGRKEKILGVKDEM